MIRYFIFSIVVLCSLAFNEGDNFKTISNESTVIQLAINKNGIPYIQQVADKETGAVYFSDASAGLFLQQRLAKNFLYAKSIIKPFSKWQLSEDSVYIKAQAAVFINQCTVTMHVELMKATSLLNIYSTVSTVKAIKIKEFPVFCADVNLADSNQTLHWWKALDYTPQKEIISTATRLSLNSRIHSSDNYNNVAGNVPYWDIESPKNFIGFSLAWSGGWHAALMVATTNWNAMFICQKTRPNSA